MARVTVSVDDEQVEVIEENVGEGAEYESKSAFVRHCISEYERAQELEARVDDLRRQLTEANRRSDDIDALAEYVEGERELQREEREHRRKPVWVRLRDYVFGW